jgi:hypothetical protein
MVMKTNQNGTKDRREVATVKYKNTRKSGEKKIEGMIFYRVKGEGKRKRRGGKRKLR